MEESTRKTEIEVRNAQRIQLLCIIHVHLELFRLMVKILQSDVCKNPAKKRKNYRCCFQGTPDEHAKSELDPSCNPFEKNQ